MANLADIVRAVAPTLATVLGGPLAGAAVSALGDALGMSEPTKDKIEKALSNGQMSGDQLAAIKKADFDFQAKMKELDIDLEKIQADDRASARDMQKTNKASIPGTLAIIVTFGFFGILIGMLAGWLHPQDNQALLLLLGALSAAWGAVMNFYYGSSRGSEIKTELMARNGK